MRSDSSFKWLTGLRLNFDEALINIVLTHILKGELKIAEIFLNDNQEKFTSNETFQKAIQILKDAKEGSKMNKYYKFSQWE